MIRYDINASQFVNDSVVEDTLATREQAVALLSQEIERYAAVLRKRFAGDVSSLEAASWSIKLEEAKAGGGPLLTAEAQYRGVTLEDLIARVFANAQAFKTMEAVLAGLSGRHRDAIAALPTREDVIAYDWRAGWPE